MLSVLIESVEFTSVTYHYNNTSELEMANFALVLLN